MNNGSGALRALCRLIRDLKPGECVEVSMMELSLIPLARLKGPLGPEWSPVDQIMERIVGSSYSIVVTEIPYSRSVRFCRLQEAEEPADDMPTYVSPDRRGRD